MKANGKFITRRPGDIGTGFNANNIGKDHILHEGKKLKADAKKSLAELKVIEQERLKAGTHYYHTSYDANGKIIQKLTKRT